MPLYVYRCEACGTEKEVMRKVSERDATLECEHLTSVFPGDSFVKSYPMHRVLTTHKSYSIKGDNSASVTPKKHRGEAK